MTGPRFRELRLLLGWSQAKAGERIGCSERTVRDMEHDRMDVKRAYGIALAAEYHHDCRQAFIRAENEMIMAQAMLDEVCSDEQGAS